MPIPLPGWWPIRRHPRNDTFTRATHGDLDIVMPPPYDMSETTQAQARAEVEQLVRRLQPGGLDAGSRDVLNNWINARADQAVARLEAERDERQSIGEILIGLAREETARRKPLYDADLARMMQAREALEITFTELTGETTIGPFAPLPQRVDDGPITSTLGTVDTSDAWTHPDGTRADPPAFGDGSAVADESRPGRGPGEAIPGVPIDRSANSGSRDADRQKHNGRDPADRIRPDVEPS
jgi:hypothetical protein